ncbi:MAG TPA: tetratricopeptide repeat protein, partial [Anaerolineales bacterium]|nr:tetratricopeptide repeat protein [Anaerolineales bacterium]
PTQLSTFIGREKEVAQIKQRLEKNHLVTLTGSGGIGKTRLSIQTASELLGEYPIGVWLVELAPLTDPALVPQTVCAALGVKPEGGTPEIEALINYMREKKILLVMDNCEHLIEACAQLCDTLLHACSQLRIIASSREALGIEGENAYRVPSLSLPDPKSGLHVIEDSEAVKLFMERAAAVLPEFQMTEANAMVIAQICQRLDGIALAIELAASRVKMLKVEQIASRLDDAFRLLTGGSRTALPRQQTLRALIDWSYNLLADDEKIFLLRLSVFMGGWTLEAAEAVCGNPDALDSLTHLADKSLVSVDLEHGDEPRYYLLETVRQYAREKLMETEEVVQLRDAHLAYFLKTAERIAPELYTRKMPYWLDYLEAEYANFQAALEWAQEHDIDAGSRLCNALFRLWQNRGEILREGLDWCKKFLYLSHDKQISPRAWVLIHATRLASVQSPTWTAPECQAWLEESLNLARKLGDEVCIVTALEELGFIEYIGTRNFDKARDLLGQSLTLSRQINYDLGASYALDWLGRTAIEQEDFPTGLILLKESLSILIRFGDLRRWGLVLNQIGAIHEIQGNWNEAQSFYEQALSVAQEAQSHLHISLGLSSLGSLAVGIGDFNRAITLLDQARELVQGTPNDKFLPMALSNIGEVARFQGNFDQAAAFYNESLSLPQEDVQKDLVYCIQAFNESLRGEILKAKQLFATGLRTIPTGYEYVVPSVIPFIAYFMINQKVGNKAVSLLGWVDGCIKAKKYYQQPAYQAEFDRYLEQVRNELSEVEFNTAWAKGQSMSQEQVLALAMEVLQ